MTTLFRNISIKLNIIFNYSTIWESQFIEIIGKFVLTYYTWKHLQTAKRQYQRCHPSRIARDSSAFCSNVPRPAKPRQCPAFSQNQEKTFLY